MIRFDRHQDLLLPKSFDYRQELRTLDDIVDALSLGQSGFSPNIHDVRSLRLENNSTLNRPLRGETNAFPIPRLSRKINHSHDERARVEIESHSVDGEFRDARCGILPVLRQKAAQMFKSEHPR